MANIWGSVSRLPKGKCMRSNISVLRYSCCGIRKFSMSRRHTKYLLIAILFLIVALLGEKIRGLWSARVVESRVKFFDDLSPFLLAQAPSRFGEKASPKLMGAEAFARSPFGYIYTGTSDGRLIELRQTNDSTSFYTPNTLGHFDRVLGLKVVSVNLAEGVETLVFCDANRGLIEARILRKDKIIKEIEYKPLLDTVDDKKIVLCNSLSFAQDAETSLIHIVLTDSSSAAFPDMFSESKSGRLITFKYSESKLHPELPANKFAATLLDGIHFANGVEFTKPIAADGKAEILMTETFSGKICKIKFDVRKSELSVLLM